MQPRALVFDVFGTCVDWRGSIIRDGQALGRSVDWPALADAWRRQGYIDPIARVRRGEQPFASSDTLLRRELDLLLPRFGLTDLSPAETEDFALFWRRLGPWPDVVEGLRRLRQRFTISPLSNGSFATLTAMAKRAGLPWDCIISTELRQTFKPDPEAYRLAASLLDLDVEQVMLVAAHANGLRRARAVGLRTALVPRPAEWGPQAPPPEVPPAGTFDVLADDFLDLARRLGA